MAQELARRVLRGTTRLAVTGVTAGFGAWAATAGVRQVLKRRADEALQIAAQTPLGRVLPDPEVPDDGAEQEAAQLSDAVRRARDRVQQTVDEVSTADPTAAPAPDPRQEEPAPPTAAEVGAPGVVTETVEQVTEQLHREHSVPAEPTRDDLPISDFDNVSLASIRGRMRRLDIEQLVVLRDWELAHAHRLPVVTMLDNRIAKLQSGEA